MKIYKKGDDFKERDDTYKTFGISEIDPNDTFNSNHEHANKIEVYGDAKLRNKIIKLLTKDEELKEIKEATKEANRLLKALKDIKG